MKRAVEDVRTRQPFAEVLAVTADVRHRHDVKRAIAQAYDRFGRIDVLINNAGIIQVGPVAHRIGVPHLVPYRTSDPRGLRSLRGPLRRNSSPER